MDNKGEPKMKNNVLLISLILVSFLLGKLNAQDHQDWKFIIPSPHSNPINHIQIINAKTWICVGGDGLYQKTTDAGLTWYFQNSAGNPDVAGTIGGNGGLYFTDANNGLITGSAGYIAKTTDGGVTFTSVAGGLIPANQNGKIMNFVDQSVGYIGFGSGDGEHGTVVNTTDGGLTWSIIYSNNSFSVSALCVPDKQTVYIITMDGSVSKSTDGGQTWNTMNTVVPQSMMCATSMDANNVLVAGSDGLCSRTTDGGDSWTQIQTPQSDWAYYQLKMVSDSEIYAVGDPGNLWKTTDFGTTWTGVPINLTWGTFDYLEWYSLDIIGSTWVITGNFGVVLISTDKGLSWGSNTVEYTTQILFDIKEFPGTNIIIAGGRQWNSGLRQVFRSTDGGTTFAPWDLITNFDVSAISLVSDKVGFVCGTNSVVMKTTDAGLNWNALTSPGGTNNLSSMKFVDEKTGWVFINYSPSDTNVFKTTDGGTTWIPQVTSGAGYGVSSADMADEDNGYLSMNSSGKPIYKTNDGGATWVPVPVPFTSQIRAIKVIDKNTLYISTNYGTKRVAKSLDGGATWTTYALPAPVDVNTMDFKNANTGYVCGNSVTAACRTTDGGISWTLENYHLPTGAKIYITPGDTAFALGTWGSILRNVSYAIPTGVRTESNTLPKGFSLAQNYPNPFNPSTIIQYNIPSGSKVKIEIFDVLGKLVSTLVSEYKAAGNYEINFNASKLSSGVYFYKLTAGSQILTKKMSLVK